MKYWLVKSEPGEWSWQDHWSKKGKVEAWTGVRNYQARNNLRAMAKGDLAFFYHSVNEKQIVGILEVVKEACDDPGDDTGRWSCVDFKAIEPMPEPVTLEAIKQEPRLADMVLVNNTRLSVQPVEVKAWKLICKMGGLKSK